MVNNIKDFADYYGTTVDRLERDIYKYTDCGAWIKWDDKSISIGSIVEGSDAEFKRTFEFPVAFDVLEAWIDELEHLTLMAWNEANGCCEEYKGYFIEYDFYGNNEYSVQYCGDDIEFTTLEEAKRFIDDMVQ